MVAIARAIGVAIGTPSDRRTASTPAIESAIAMITLDVLGCSNSRTISGLKLVSDDCGQSIDSKRSPACQSRSPTKSKPDAVEQARVLADRELAHPLQDEQLDLGDVGQVDERLDLALVAVTTLQAGVLTGSAPAR